MAVSGTKTVSCDTFTQGFAPSSQSETEPTFSPLSKQNSILSLTLDEIQCKSGKSFGSMSMDEFLASIWNSSDDNQPNPIVPNNDESCRLQSKSKSVAVVAEQPITIPPPISKKTVEEVWSEIHEGQQHPQQRMNEGVSGGGGNNNHLVKNERLKKQTTLGEMTLEDFLIKAGVVQESTLSSSSAKASLPQLTTAMPFQNQIGSISASNVRPLDAGYGVRPSIGIGGFCSQQNVGNHNGLPAYTMLTQNNCSVARDPSTCLAVEKCQSLPVESSGSSSRKRVIDGPLEVVVERRQRRMLKNRESAARSRARRQAYTVELEAELNLLKQENEKLKQILAEAESKRKQEVSKRKHTTKAQKNTEKLKAIRRTVSAAW